MKRFLLFASCLLGLSAWSQQAVSIKLQEAAPNCFATPEASIRFRCSGTLNKSNTPLIVVDGIPVEGKNLSDIDPSLIENIGILKAAEAGAFYGSKGAIGVIVITLKKLKNISLTIVDENDSMPLPYASINLSNENESKSFISNDKGEVSLPSLLKDLEYKIEVTSVGYLVAYKQLKLERDKQTIVIPLKKNIKKLDEVVVTSNGSIRCRLCCGLRISWVHDCQLSISAEKRFAFSVFPNPISKGQMLKVYPKKAANNYYEVFSVSGQLMQAGKVTMKDGQSFHINTTGLVSGVYFIRVTNKSSGDQSAERFIVH